jgi:3-oxoacyl-[acyl-carrier protein] reductase
MTQDTSDDIGDVAFDRLSIPQGSRLLLMGGNGGNGGIGGQLAERALVLGAEIVSLDTERAIAERPLPSWIACIPIDARNETSLRTAFDAVAQRWKAIDGFVFLTGFSPPLRSITETPVNDWDEVMNVNLRSAFLAMQMAVPLMKQPGGSIVAVSSGLAINVERGWGPYAATKAGLIALAKVLAKEVAPGIRVNLVAPGMVDTPFLSGGTGRTGNTPRPKVQDMPFYKAVQPTMLMGRVAVADDVVGPVLFLLGEGSRYMTGQTIHINGGRYMP